MAVGPRVRGPCTPCGGGVDTEQLWLEHVDPGPRVAVLRRILRHLRPSTPAPPIPVAAGPLASATCLDLRRPSALRFGIVQGALLLTEDDALRLRDHLPPCVVLHDTPAQAQDLAARLGQTAGPADLAAWTADGAPLRLPDEKAPLVLRQPVRLDASGEVGWVQDICWADHEFRFAVLLLRDGALTRLDDLPEEALTPENGRGAAGLGEQIGNHSAGS